MTTTGWRQRSSALSEQDDFACEYRVIRADGATVWILERGRRVRVTDGPAPLLDGLLFDITERKRAQEELRERVAEQAAYRAVTKERTPWPSCSDRLVAMPRSRAEAAP